MKGSYVNWFQKLYLQFSLIKITAHVTLISQCHASNIHTLIYKIRLILFQAQLGV